MDPTTDKIIDALRTLRLQHPALGQKKALAQLNSDHNWALTNKHYKIHLAELVKQEAKAPEQKDNTEDQGKEKSRTQQKKGSREKKLEEGRTRKAQQDNEDDTDPEMPELEEADTGASSTAQHQTTSDKKEQNCFLIRAAPHSSTTPPRSAILDQISPFNLKHYGQEYSEMAELKKRLGWNDCREVGKFYDHLGTDSWYYYVYGQRGSTGPKNDVANLVCSKQIRGDVAVIRSGPGGSNYPEDFTKGELAEAVEWYKTHDREKEFAAREKSRIFRTMGIGGRQSSMPHHYTNMTSHGMTYS